MLRAILVQVNLVPKLGPQDIFGRSNHWAYLTNTFNSHFCMKNYSILIITITAMVASCTPNSSTNLGNRKHWYSDFTEPAEEQKQYRKIPLGHPDPRGRTNMVVSPFRPYNIIDISGYRSGDIVGDPSTAKVNPATGRRDSNTVKHFRIP